MNTEKMLSLEEVQANTQIDKGRDHQADRLAELADFYAISEADATALYKRYNLKRDKSVRIGAFVPDSWDTIFASYNDPERVKKTISRMLIGSSRVKGATRVLNALLPHFPEPSRARVIDYGCGAADHALSFASFGFHPIIVDLAGPKLDWASWRFTRRGLAHDVVKVTPDIEYPKLPAADIVLSGEVLEHMRDPLAAVTSAYEALPAGGFLWLSSFPFQEKDVGGDHLQSAADARLATLAYLEERFTLLPDVRYLMRKN